MGLNLVPANQIKTVLILNLEIYGQNYIKSKMTEGNCFQSSYSYNGSFLSLFNPDMPILEVSALSHLIKRHMAVCLVSLTYGSMLQLTRASLIPRTTVII